MRSVGRDGGKDTSRANEERIGCQDRARPCHSLLACHLNVAEIVKCVAKNDNIQDWLSNAAGIGKVSRSDSPHDLAYSVAAEFAAIAEEVREPYYEEARKSCEAEIRADCAKKGITDEAEIARRIESKVALLVADNLPETPMSPPTKAKPQFSEPANSCPSRPSVQRHPAV